MIAATALLAACSKDEDPAPARQGLQNVSLSMAAGTGDLIEVPAAIATLSDEHAMMVDSYAGAINEVCAYLAYFHPPAEAEKGSMQIAASNSRKGAAKNGYLVYSWTSQDKVIAYQVSQQNDKNVFEVFTKASDKKWLLHVYAEETADGKKGQIQVYGPADGLLASTYTWARNGDLINIAALSELQDLQTSITIHTKSREGSAEYHIGAAKIYSLTWDTRGNGTWKRYKEDGAVAAGGAWRV